MKAEEVKDVEVADRGMDADHRIHSQKVKEEAKIKVDKAPAADSAGLCCQCGESTDHLYVARTGHWVCLLHSCLCEGTGAPGGAPVGAQAANAGAPSQLITTGEVADSGMDSDHRIHSQKVKEDSQLLSNLRDFNEFNELEEKFRSARASFMDERASFMDALAEVGKAPAADSEGLTKVKQCIL